MIPYVAIVVALVVAFCFGLLTGALVAASKRQPAGSAPRYRRLFVGESAEEHLKNSLQLLSSIVFARGELGKDAADVVLAATKRIETAIQQIKKEAA